MEAAVAAVAPADPVAMVATAAEGSRRGQPAVVAAVAPAVVVAVVAVAPSSAELPEPGLASASEAPT